MTEHNQIDLDTIAVVYEENRIDQEVYVQPLFDIFDFGTLVYNDGEALAPRYLIDLNGDHKKSVTLGSMAIAYDANSGTERFIQPVSDLFKHGPVSDDNGHKLEPLYVIELNSLTVADINRIESGN